MFKAQEGNNKTFCMDLELRSLVKAKAKPKDCEVGEMIRKITIPLKTLQRILLEQKSHNTHQSCVSEQIDIE